VCNIGHECVRIVYFDILNRYAKLFTANPQLIGNALSVLLDERGTRSPNKAVAMRASYIFARFVRTLQKDLHPFVDKLFDATKTLLTVDNNYALQYQQIQNHNQHQQQQQQQPQKSLQGHNSASSMEEQLHIYEALGSIISQDKVAPQVRAIMLEVSKNNYYKNNNNKKHNELMTIKLINTFFIDFCIQKK